MFKALLHPTTWSLTWRFLRQLRHKSSSKLFALICVAGIALTVFVFFAVNAVVLGYQGHIRKTLMGFQSPLTLVSTTQDEHQRQYQALQAWQQSETEHPFQIQEYREFYALLNMPKLAQPIGVKVRSLSEAQAATFGDQTQFYWNADFDLANFSHAKSAVVLGSGLFNKLPVGFSDEDFVDLIHPFADLGPTGEFEPQTLPFEIAGLMQSGVHDIDEYYVFVSDEALQNFSQSAAYKWIWKITPDSEADLQVLQKHWIAFAPEQKPLISWYDQNKTLVKLMQLEKTIITILFVLLFFITTANLTSLTHIFGMSHLKSMMILKALGLSTAQIKAIFWQFGLTMGVMGTALGLSLGASFVWLFITYPFHLPETYGFTELPLVFPKAAFWILCFGVPAFCVLLSILPARKYVQQSVVDVLRKT